VKGILPTYVSIVTAIVTIKLIHVANVHDSGQFDTRDMGSMPSSDRSMLAEKVTHVEPQAD
jgi:hypothetical protein